METAIETLRAAGLAIDRADPHWPENTAESRILPIEQSGLAAVLGEAWHTDPETFDSHIGAQIEAGLSLTGAEVARAWNFSLELAATLARFFAEYDLLLCPTLACVSWPADRLNPASIGGAATPHRGHACFTPLFNHGRTPAITIPCGAGRDCLPVGLQIIGARFADMQVLAASAWMEAALAPLCHELRQTPANNA
jgi:aspartyl-tRNA(Asn)/glutamyl-tRNA(Gln) amidotransferase subunit A